MAKWQNDSMLDEALNWIKDNCNEMIVCTSQPTTYAQATDTPASSGYALADVAMTASDFTLAAGDTSGRKATVAQKANVSIDYSGTAQHIALVGSVSSTNTLLYVTTCSDQSLTASNQVTIPAWDIELRDAQ